MKEVTYILLVLIFSSCTDFNTLNEKEIHGVWVIRQMEYRGEDFKEQLLSINLVNIRENKTVQLPAVNEFKDNEKSIWNLDNTSKSPTLFIKSRNTIFNGKHKIQLIDGENYKILILESKDLFLELNKS